MGYDCQNFKDGQVLTADCLNKMEQGIAGAFKAVPPACENKDCSKVLSYSEDGFKWVDLPEGVPGTPGADGQPGKDGNGIKSAVLNADYTLTLTFDNGTSYTTPSIRGAAGAVGSAGKDGSNGTDGVGIASIKQTTTSTADGGNNVFTVTLTNGTSATFTVKNGSKGSAGDAGKDGEDYVLTNADKAEIAEMVEGATVVQAPKYVNSEAEMVDQSRVYVMASTNEIWAWMDTSVEKEVTVTDQIVGTTDNPYQVGRLSSNGGFGEATAGYVITPYIDLTQAKYAGKTIELHLDGNRYVSEANETYIQMAIFKTDKTVLNGRTATCLDKSVAILPVLTNVTTKINGETSATMTIKIPASYNGTTIGYWRFCGKGTEAASNVYITYKEMQTVTGGQWVNTKTIYAPAASAEDLAAIAEQAAAIVDENLLAVIGTGEVTV